MIDTGIAVDAKLSHRIGAENARSGATSGQFASVLAYRRAAHPGLNARY
jgi:hypothetical protein